MIFEKANLEDPIYNEYNIFTQCGFGLPNCTAYAWGRVQEVLGHACVLPLGDAIDWWENSIALGIPTGQEPKVGSIVVFDCGECGHVAFVENVNGNVIEISQSHWNGVIYDTDFIYTDQMPCKYNNIVGYIYPFDLNDYIDNYIDTTYIELLKRRPDAEGLNSYRQMALEENWLGCIDDSIKSSPEYRYVQHRTFIEDCYKNLLAREPDAEGLESYMKFARYRDVVYDIKQSEEYRQRYEE